MQLLKFHGIRKKKSFKAMSASKGILMAKKNQLQKYSYLYVFYK